MLSKNAIALYENDATPPTCKSTFLSLVSIFLFLATYWFVLGLNLFVLEVTLFCLVAIYFLFPLVYVLCYWKTSKLCLQHRYAPLRRPVNTTCPLDQGFPYLIGLDSTGFAHPLLHTIFMYVTHADKVVVLLCLHQLRSQVGSKNGAKMVQIDHKMAPR